MMKDHHLETALLMPNASEVSGRQGCSGGRDVYVNSEHGGLGQHSAKIYDTGHHFLSYIIYRDKEPTRHPSGRLGCVTLRVRRANRSLHSVVPR